MMSRPLSTALLSLALGAMAALPASATDGQVCPALDSGRVEAAGGQLTVTVDAPAGQVIMSYCVAAGSGDGPELIAVDPGVATLLLSHPSGTPIVHWSVTYGTVTAPADETPAETWWPTAPSAPVDGEVPPAPAPVVEPAPLAAPAAIPRPGPTTGAPPMPASAGGRSGGPTSPPNAAPAKVTASSAAPAGAAPSVAVPPEAAAPVLPQPARGVPSTDGAVQMAAKQEAVGAQRRAGHPRAERSVASEVAPVTSTVRQSGMGGEGEIGAVVAALLMLGLGSTAAVLHVARREPAKP